MNGMSIAFALVGCISFALLAAMVHVARKVVAERDAQLALMERHYTELRDLAVMFGWGIDRVGARLNQAHDACAAHDNFAVMEMLIVAGHELAQLRNADPAGFEPTPIEPVVIRRRAMVDIDPSAPVA